MKKTLVVFSSALLLIVVLAYTLLFTQLGNDLLRPTVQTKINQYSPLPLTLDTFSLSTDRLKLIIQVDGKNSLIIEGVYSLFAQDFDIDYAIKFTDLSTLNTVLQRKLSGQLFSDGNIKGDLELFKIKGKSDLALSKTKYAIVLKEMELDKAAIKLSNIDIKTLLRMLGEKAYSSGKVDVHVQLNDLDPTAMQGSVVLNIKEANLNAKTLQKEFGLNVSKTSLKGGLKATLEGTDISYLAKIDSVLANIYSKGKLETDKDTIDSSYKIDIKELALLRSIINAPLRGPLFIEGKIHGKEKTLGINGTSDLAGSNTSYEVKIIDLKPSKLNIQIQDAALERLLYMSGKPKYAKARLNANIQLNNLDPKRLDGLATIQLLDGRINQTIMRKDFDVKLPKTDFRLQADTTLKAENIDYIISLNSNLANIKSKGKVRPENLFTKASYDINIKELALLKPLTQSPFRGPFTTSGTVNGDKQELLVKGSSDLAQSKTKYDIILKELALEKIDLNIKDAKLEKLLYLAGEPSYASGDINLKTELSTITPVNGDVKLSIGKGIAHAKEIKKAFDITLPYTKFELVSDANIKEDRVVAKTTLTSNLATLRMKKTSYDIKDASLLSDYDIFIPSLKRLEPILDQKLYGEVKANGEIIKSDKLTISAHSNIFDGKLNAKIVDEKVDASFKDLHAIKVLQMLGYPKVMDAPINGTLVYNTKTKQGKLDSRFEKATLKRSQMTDLISGLTRNDLTKERFNEGSLVSIINKDIIKSDLKMQSKRVSLNSKKFIINSKKQLIDANFALQIKKYKADILVTDNINSPKVRLDAKSMITPEIEKKAVKEINRFLKKLF